MPRRGSRIFICGDDGPPVDPNPACRRANLHTPSPEGYVAASAWADRMVKTHRQLQCPGCGLWVIWEPKRPWVETPASLPGEGHR